MDTGADGPLVLFHKEKGFLNGRATRDGSVRRRVLRRALPAEVLLGRHPGLGRRLVTVLRLLIPIRGRGAVLRLLVAVPWRGAVLRRGLHRPSGPDVYAADEHEHPENDDDYPNGSRREGRYHPEEQDDDPELDEAAVERRGPAVATVMHVGMAVMMMAHVMPAHGSK